MREWVTFRGRARWAAFLTVGLPIAGIVLVVVVPAVRRMFE